MNIKPITTYVIEMDGEEADALRQFMFLATESAVGNANPRQREVARQFAHMLTEADPNPPF